MLALKNIIIRLMTSQSYVTVAMIVQNYRNQDNTKSFFTLMEERIKNLKNSILYYSILPINRQYKEPCSIRFIRFPTKILQYFIRYKHLPCNSLSQQEVRISQFSEYFYKYLLIISYTQI